MNPAQHRMDWVGDAWYCPLCGHTIVPLTPFGWPMAVTHQGDPTVVHYAGAPEPEPRPWPGLLRSLAAVASEIAREGM